MRIATVTIQWQLLSDEQQSLCRWIRLTLTRTPKDGVPVTDDPLDLVPNVDVHVIDAKSFERLDLEFACVGLDPYPDGSERLGRKTTASYTMADLDEGLPPVPVVLPEIEAVIFIVGPVREI